LLQAIVIIIETFCMLLSKKHFLIVILSFVTVFCKAQQFKERVYLKDSITFYEGYIIEQAPAKYVKIYRLLEKDTITVPLTDVLRLTKMFTIDSVAKPELKVGLQIKKPTYSKVVFLELLGAGGLYSVNYDMRTAKGKRDGWGFRVGYERMITVITDSTPTEKAQSRISFTAIPIVLNYLFGKRKNFLELGVGATYFHFIGKATGIASIESYKEETFKETFGSIIGSFNIGYRRVPYKGGFMYRVAFTPLLVDNLLVPFIGIGLGYHFK
jgi:hypothetical protein